MTRLREILRDRKGNGFPLAIAITLALVIIFCGILTVLFNRLEKKLDYYKG